jgi:hypothetical protein
MLIMLRRHVLRLGAIANRPHVPLRAAFLINGIPAPFPAYPWLRWGLIKNSKVEGAGKPLLQTRDRFNVGKMTEPT